MAVDDGLCSVHGRYGDIEDVRPEWSKVRTPPVLPYWRWLWERAGRRRGVSMAPVKPALSDEVRGA